MVPVDLPVTDRSEEELFEASATFRGLDHLLMLVESVANRAASLKTCCLAGTVFRIESQSN
jgi:hypothetical protein